MAQPFFLTRRRFLRWGAALGAGATVPFRARYIEPYALEVTRHEVFLPGLPAERNGFTLVHLSDLHRGRVTPDSIIADAVRVTGTLRPDAVMITGDFIDCDYRDALPLARMLSPLAPPHGVWGCLGNHDYGTSADNVVGSLARGGVRMLRNQAAPLAPGLWVAGIEDTWVGPSDSVRAMKPIPDEAAAIFLTHNPVGVYACERRPWLALAGHTHGGQVRLWGVPPRFPGGMDGFPLNAGWGTFGQARLYISRGVGMIGLPLRLACRPEIALLTLRRGDGPPRTASASKKRPGA